MQSGGTSLLRPFEIQTDSEKNMQIGMIGLGRMGANMVQRLLAGGHACVVYARTKSTRDEMAALGADAADSSEGRWRVKTAVDLGVPAHVLAAALFNRFSSRGEATYANKVLCALRYAFGGHVEKQ